MNWNSSKSCVFFWSCAVPFIWPYRARSVILLNQFMSRDISEAFVFYISLCPGNVSLLITASGNIFLVTVSPKGCVGDFGQYSI